MKPKVRLLLLGAAFVALPAVSWGQPAAAWRAYKAADGLPETACMSVTVSPNGRVLAKQLNSGSVTEYDGYTFNVFPPPQRTRHRVYESPAGQLWAVATDGLLEFKDGDWALHPVQEIAAEIRANPQNPVRPIPLSAVRQGRVLFLLADRLLEFSAEDVENPRTEVLRTAAQTQLGSFSGMTLVRDGGLCIAGRRGLIRFTGPVRSLKPESEWREFLPPPDLEVHDLQEPTEDTEGGITAVAETRNGAQKVIVHFDGQHWTAKSTGNEKILRAWRGPDQTRWAMSADALFRQEGDGAELVRTEELPARQFYDLAVEPGGAFWLATSDGLYRYALTSWNCPAAARRITSTVHSLTEDQEGRLWFLSENRLHSIQDGNLAEFPLPAGLSLNPGTEQSLFLLKDGMLLLKAHNQSVKFQPKNGQFPPLVRGKELQQINPLGPLPDGRLGVLSVETGTTKPERRLESYDGALFQPFPGTPPKPELDGSLTTLLIAKNSDVWLGGDQGIAWYHDKKWRMFAASDKTLPEGALRFAEMMDGRIWCAAPDKVWEFDGRNWSVVRAGFDHIQTMLRARDGAIWVGSGGGLHRFFQKTWVEVGTEDGLPGTPVTELCEDRRGRLWAGTGRGLSLYQPEADTEPPRTFIQELPDKDAAIPEGGTVTIRFAGQDKWKFTPQERLLFSYRLDDRDWSPFRDSRSVSFTDLPAGRHYFQVRAMDVSGNVDPKAASLEFVAVVPWYKEMRLVLIAFSGTTVALFFAALAFNRHRKLRRSYTEVERKIAERTRELERANRELVHSQKMNALGTLSAGIAHDFNNILSIIKGSSQIIEDNLDNPEKVRIRLDRIKTVVQQGAGIVEAMLGFSRNSDQQSGPSDLNVVVDDTIKLLGDRFLREVEVRFARGADLPEIPVARDFVQQVLLNFIFNAADAMERRSPDRREAGAMNHQKNDREPGPPPPQSRKHITITTQLLGAPPAGAVLQPARAEAYVAISVEDTGSGITPENLPRIFEPFFTTKAMSARRGTGLGLTMVYELARKLEAGLAVESVTGQGSTFTILLPVRETSANPEPESKSHHAFNS